MGVTGRRPEGDTPRTAAARDSDPGGPGKFRCRLREPASAATLLRPLERLMRCLVYRSTLRADTYLYLPREDALEQVPESLRERLGRLEFALEFDLTPERRLAHCDARSVLARIEAHGYYLQLPPGEWIGT